MIVVVVLWLAGKHTVLVVQDNLLKVQSAGMLNKPRLMQ